ncbi:MAG: hypothetical protein NTV51_14555 [Verrucomicrobia bacterium]|nr:hypothetical protein [Verrucomicrobiota bacterium]
MRSVAANVRRAAEQATLQFDWLVPDRPMLRVVDVVTATGMRTTFIEELFADKCHRYGADSRERAPMRIPRAFVIELLIKSAKYDAETKLQAVMGLAREFTAEECEQIAAHFRDTAAKKLSR